jgi:hypothetical protein
MTSQAKMATGAFVIYNGSVYAELTEITPPSYSVEKVDATSHDSTVKVSIAGQAAFGDMTFKANFVNDTTQAALRVLAMAKTVGVWQFVYPTSSGLPTYSVPGFISAYSVTAPLKGAPAAMSVTITPTDTVTQVTGTGYGTETPFIEVACNSGAATLTSAAQAAAVYIYDYSVSQACVDHFHLTVTSATGSPTIYIDGTATASGAPSAALTYTLASNPTGSIKTVFVVVAGLALKPTVYTMRFTRSAA